MTIGLENRYHFSEFPNPDEMAALIADYPPEVAGFWLDIGHAEVLERLGFIDHRRWLDELARAASARTSTTLMDWPTTGRRASERRTGRTTPPSCRR